MKLSKRKGVRTRCFVFSELDELSRRPRGRCVDSSPRRRAVVLAQLASPRGLPRRGRRRAASKRLLALRYQAASWRQPRRVVAEVERRLIFAVSRFASAAVDTVFQQKTLTKRGAWGVCIRSKPGAKRGMLSRRAASGEHACRPGANAP